MGEHRLPTRRLEETEAEWRERKRAFEAAVAEDEKRLAAVRAAIAKHLKGRE